MRRITSTVLAILAVLAMAAGTPAGATVEVSEVSTVEPVEWIGGQERTELPCHLAEVLGEPCAVGVDHTWEGGGER